MSKLQYDSWINIDDKNIFHIYDVRQNNIGSETPYYAFYIQQWDNKWYLIQSDLIHVDQSPWPEKLTDKEITAIKLGILDPRYE